MPCPSLAWPSRFGYYAPRVRLFEAPAAPGEVVLERLHIPVPRRHELAVIVMRRMGIAASDIVVDPITEPGTNNVALATARYARSHGVRRVIVLTYRSHSRRTAVLLRNALGRSSEIIVRPAPDDPFHPEGWWRDRSTCREAMMEGIRWMNSVLFGDLLSRERFQSGI